MKKIIEGVLKKMSESQANLGSQYCRKLIAAEIVQALKQEKQRRENECAE